MKKPFLSLAVISTALNISPLLAQEIISQHNYRGEIVQVDFSISIETMIQNYLSDLIEALDFDENEEELGAKILSIQSKFRELEDQDILIANSVKAKMLSRLLESGVVVIDESVARESNRIPVSFNSKIVSKLEAQGAISFRVAKEGTVCW